MVQIFSSFVAWYEIKNGGFVNAIIGVPTLSADGKEYQFEIAVPSTILKPGQEVYLISKNLATNQVLDRLPDQGQPQLTFSSTCDE